MYIQPIQGDYVKTSLDESLQMGKEYPSRTMSMSEIRDCLDLEAGPVGVLSLTIISALQNYLQRYR